MIINKFEYLRFTDITFFCSFFVCILRDYLLIVWNGAFYLTTNDFTPYHIQNPTRQTEISRLINR